MTDIRILSGPEISKALSMKDAIDAMRSAFRALHNGSARLPQRIHMETEKGTTLFMPATLESAIGIKTVTLFPDNPKNNIPYIQGTYCLFDGTNGTPIAFMDGKTLTAIRTGAASGLATDILARKDSKTVAILGAGVQGRTQLRAICEVRKIKQVNIFDPVTQSAESFAQEMGLLLGIPITMYSTSAEAIADADIICAATISPTPVFSDKDLKKGVHINAVGSYKPDVQEIPEETVLRSKLVVDERKAAIEETGDLIIPINKGIITAEHIYADLGQLVSGTKPGRTDDLEITFFKSVGLAIQDLAAAGKALARAEEMNLGKVVEI